MSIIDVLANVSGFRHPGRARRDLEVIAEGLRPETLRQIESLLTVAPDPDRVVHGMAALKREHPAVFQAIAISAHGPQRMMAVFAWSRFLTEEVIQHPDWLQTLADLVRVRSTEEYIADLEGALGAESGPPDMLVFAQFRRRAILRLLICDVLGLATLSAITEQLSNLADAILEVSLRRIRGALVHRHGTPRYRDEHGVLRECGFAVIALGKLGGRELNYSSDIDLMFVYTANGETDGPHPLTNKEFFKKVGNQYTEMLSTYTVEGMCYRVDLRLRPDGSLGEICISLDGAKSYYQQRARDWELQMLIKARVAAGNRATGEALLDHTAPLTYASSLDFSAVEAVSATRLRIGEKLSARRPGKAGFDIKLAPGGIRDIEFLVQCLQRLHGGREPWVQQGGTLLALSRLNDKGLISETEYGRLAAAYSFLRHLEHRLQFEDDRQTHTLPGDNAELESLARRMPHEPGVDPSAEILMTTLNGHLTAVQETYDRVIHAQQPMYYGVVAEPAEEPEPTEEAILVEPAASNLVRFLDQRAPSLARLLSRYPMKRGAHMFEHFLERVIANSEWLPELDREPALARDVLDIFENSPYFADELIRTPDLLHALAILEERPSDDLDDLADPVSLRRFFRREMFRIEAESICRRVWVFSTLERTSALADSILGAAYRLAIRETLYAHPPIEAVYRPTDQMSLIALGRLGMSEFDLSSDADLLFVVPEEDSAELVFWTRVAERIIDILTAYTGEGTLLAVDTRLRPNGSSGALVQTDRACLDYFARGAEAWEGIAYMKSRAVAGNVDGGTAFLHRLQDVDWRRYGQSGRSRQSLRNMRARVEKEQGNANPLKAGLGGYYDIDFILMYMRLKAAGLFFKVLNTPERIDVIEKTGHLDRADAEFLRDAATFYRAVDHGLRVYSGHAEGHLPGSTTQMECLTELVHRWAPEHMTRQPIAAQLAQIKARTRETFDRLFV